MPGLPPYAEPRPVPPGVALDEIRALLRDVYAADRRARQVLPPGIAQVVSEEFESFIEIGHRYGSPARIRQLIREIHALPPRTS